MKTLWGAALAIGLGAASTGALAQTQAPVPVQTPAPAANTVAVRPQGAPDRAPDGVSSAAVCEPGRGPAARDDFFGLGRRWSRFQQGDLQARDCALEGIRRQAALRRPARIHDATRAEVEKLYGFYGLRAERQQTFMDVGSTIVFLGAAGAGLSGNVSTNTQQAWAIAGFSPIVISQFNANEPTRELFQGGAVAIQLITARYDRLDDSYRGLKSLVDGAAATDCSGIDTTFRDLRPPDGKPLAWDPNGLLLAEASRLIAACERVGHTDTRLAAFSAESEAGIGRWESAYAADVLRLDHNILAQDRTLRYSPTETLGALLSAPLRAADMLITGTQTQAAVDSLTTAIVFSGLDQQLTALDLPDVPPTPEVVELSPDVAAYARIALAAHRVKVQDAVRNLDSFAGAVETARLGQARRLVLARQMAAAANADFLTFDYDVVSHTSRVVLGPERVVPVRSPASGTAGATTAAGATAPL